jgi:hypothetical protein
MIHLRYSINRASICSGVLLLLQSSQKNLAEFPHGHRVSFSGRVIEGIQGVVFIGYYVLLFTPGFTSKDFCSKSICFFWTNIHAGYSIHYFI